MPLATTEDVADRLGRDLTGGEPQTVALLLDAATAVIADAAGKDDDWADTLDPVPQILRFLAIEVACRALANPNALDSLQEQVGATSYSARFRNDGGGLMLTPIEERLVRRTVLGTASGSVRVDSQMDDAWDYMYGS